MLLDRFQNLISNGKHRIETGHRLLKDHRNLVTANLSLVYLRQSRDFSAFIMYLATGNKSRRMRHKLAYRQRCHTLAAAGFPNDRKNLVMLNLKGHTIHSKGEPFRSTKVGLEVINAQ